MTLYRFSRWRLVRRNFTFSFGLGDMTLFGGLISISRPNVVEMTIHVCNITIFGLEKRTSAILEFYFAVSMSFCTSLRNFIQIGRVMSIFKMADPVLLYHCPLLCDFNVPIKGLIWSPSSSVFIGSKMSVCSLHTV